METTKVFWGFILILVIESSQTLSFPPKHLGFEYLGRTGHKLFYKASNAETYEAASDCCEDLGGQLVTFMSPNDRKALLLSIKRLSSRFWVGAVPNSDCMYTQYFKKNCWIWEISDLTIDEYGISWNPRLTVPPLRKQTAMSRAYFETKKQTLNFDENTATHSFVCEINSNLLLTKTIDS